MPTGKVKFWSAEKGYGFITQDDGGPDLFVRVSGVLSSIDPQPGQQVSFEVEEDHKAVKVRVLE